VSKQHTVIINGTKYDAVSGKPLGLTEATKSTLSTKKPVHTPAPAPAPTARQIQEIRRFAPHPKPQTIISDIAPVHHPVVDRVHAARATQQLAVGPRVVKPSQIIKREAIIEATSRMPTKPARQIKLKKRVSTARRRLNIAAISLAVLVFGGYLTYLNMPQISTRVAASQAGINAQYPSYHPTGYSLSGPVAFNNGVVSMKFAANTSPQAYTVTQSRSNWDSSAVLENYVQPKAGEHYTTTQSNGLTIYTYDKSAAWVNGGILYTIDGSANLTPEQIQHIAVSM
jgi:hypothetical protein